MIFWSFFGVKKCEFCRATFFDPLPLLSNSEERVFSAASGVEKQPLGLYVIRGDTVALIGEVDTDLDGVLDFTSIKAAPIKSLYWDFELLTILDQVLFIIFVFFMKKFDIFRK